MGIDVQLRSDNGDIVSFVSDEMMIISRATKSSFSGTRLFKYLVPWGDTIYNQAQAGDLSLDILELKRAHSGTPLGNKLIEIQILVDRLAAETHLYLWFIGD